MHDQCYRPVADKVLWMCSLLHWYHTGGLPQLCYFPQHQAHIEHVSHDATQLVCAAPPEADAIRT